MRAWWAREHPASCGQSFTEDTGEMGFLKTLRGWMARGRTFLEMVQMLLLDHSLPAAALFSFSSKYSRPCPWESAPALPLGICPSPHWSSRCRRVSFQSAGASSTLSSCASPFWASGGHHQMYAPSSELLMVLSGTHMPQHQSKAGLTLWNCCQRDDRICVLSPDPACILKGHRFLFNSVGVRIIWHHANSALV